MVQANQRMVVGVGGEGGLEPSELCCRNAARRGAVAVRIHHDQQPAPEYGAAADLERCRVERDLHRFDLVMVAR